MKKSSDMLIALLIGGIFYFFLYFYYVVINDYISEEDYARMAQELVKQSIALDQNQCSSQNVEQ